MRPIDRDGWGNKFRAPGNSKTAFKTWAQQNLREWKEQFSELGAMYLERAGFQAEAERFRIGHLSRPERAKAAHDRGDLREFERLLDEPQRYLAPAVSAMERGGKRTRTGDINREVEERNKLRGPTREIRFAYALADGDHHAFVKALGRKDMVLTKISSADEMNAIVEFAYEPSKYVPQYRKSEHVILTETGQVYRLTPTTTGENWKTVREFSKKLYDREFPSLATALEEQKKRSLIPKLDRNKITEQMMQSGPLDGTSQRSADEARERRTAVPEGPRHLSIQGVDGEQVWWAYNSSKDAESLLNSIKERGLPSLA
jgi:hypothetical protein